MRQDRKALAMLDIPDMPALAFRRRLGSLAPATLEGGGNPIEDLLSSVSDVASGIGDAVSGVVDAVSDVGASVDDFVNDVIPGGWVGVGAAALLAYGIYDPEILGAAEEGTLTSTKLANAGYDAVNVARDVSALSPELVSTTQAAISSGVSPELIAMANATADPIAALNAAAGWTASDAAYLSSIGYAGMVVNPVTGVATPVNTLLNAQAQGWQAVAPNANAPAGAQFQDEWGTYFNANGESIGQEIVTKTPMPAGPEPTQLPGGVENVTTPGPVSPVAPVTPTVDPAAVQNYLNQGYTQAQIDAAIEANPNGGWGRSLSWGEMGAPGAEVPGATIDVSNMTQEQLNQALSQNNPYLESGPGGQVASAETPFRVDVSGTAGFEGNPSAVTGPITEGSQLATQAQIDAGAATYNPAANAWEVAGAPPPPMAPIELSPVVPAEIGGLGAGASIYGAGGAGYVAPVVADAAAAIVADAGLTATQVAVLGGTVAAATVVNSVGASGAAQAANQVAASTPVVETPVAPTPAPVTTAPPVVETPVTTTSPVAPTPVAPTPAPVTTAPPVTTPPPVTTAAPVVETPVAPAPVTTAPPVTTPPPAYTGPGIGEIPNPAEVPVTDLSTVAQPMGPSPYDWVAPAVVGAGVGALAAGALSGGGGAAPAGYGPITPVKFGQLGALSNPGLNPGFIQARPYYNTTSPVQAQYYWGNHPYTYDQADLANYNNIPYAPAVPWGVQSAQAPFDVNAFIRSTITPQSQAAAAGTAPQYYAPYATTAYTGNTPK